MNIKVTLSSGIGRLHFNEIVQSLERFEIEKKLVTGWTPPKCLSPFVDLFGHFIGQRNLASRLRVRGEIAQFDCKVIGLLYPEFREHVCKKFPYLTYEDRSEIARRSWEIFGAQTKQHLEGQIFHVRSGAGQGGAIAEAKRLGMLVIVDHSIAHPLEIEANLRRLHEAHCIDFGLSPDSPFWTQVMQDCEDGDTVLVNSDYVKDTFVRNGFEPSKIKVLYWGVRSDFLKAKTEYTVKKGSKIQLFFTGNFSLRKGASVMIDAAELLKAEGLDFVFNIAGTYEEGHKLLEEKSHLKQYFNFFGFVLQPQLRDLFVKSDIFVFPSFAEGSARSAMEAMGASMPCIFTPETGSPAVDGESGLIIEKGSASALADSILKLSQDEKLRADLGSAAGDLISNQLQWSNFGVKLEGIYKETLER